MRVLSTILVAATMAMLAAATAHAAPRGDCRLDKADRTVHGVTLGDTESARKVLRSQLDEEHKAKPLDREGGDFPWYVYFSGDRAQTVAFRSHPGDVVDSYQEIEVRDARIGPEQMLAQERSYYVGREAGSETLAAKAFVSGSGIRLGMTKADVVKRIGRCFKTASKGDMQTIRYRVEDETAQLPILKQGNMPSYYAEYQFQRGRLVRFRIGHDYP